MTQRILTWSFYILFFFTPLFFTKYNSELFEFNKMMLVYWLTTIIVGTWLIKMVSLKSLIFNRTPLDIPIALFLLSQILSTIFSIDIHTSLWGYYSRSNGGLISIICYILLYYALVFNFNWEQAQKLLKSALWGGLAVSLYAIPEHFGVSPSCVLLQGTLSADCWVQQVQDRVFATLGQPNWLAAYLEMLIFPAIYFALTAENRSQTIRYAIFAILYYLAFTFTYSRGAMIGLIVAVAVFLISWGIQNTRSNIKSAKQTPKLPFKLAGIIFGAFILINLLFGSALTGEFRLLKISPLTARPTLSSSTASVGTQLENGGTESGIIRLIVWRGALDIFKHYPIFGSGVETFAYSYYQFRPVQHNLVSEWDFLYNKAHNEYLNYLATTGIVGFLTYMLLILAFLWWSLSWIFDFPSKILELESAKKIKGGVEYTHHQVSIWRFILTRIVPLTGPVLKAPHRMEPDTKLAVSLILASYTAYLVQNFFGFSVVIVALFFFVFPAFTFLASNAIWTFNLDKKHGLYTLALATIYSQRWLRILTMLVIGAATILTLWTLIAYWRADTFYKIGQDYNDNGSPGRAFNTLLDAVDLNPNEPIYRSELANAAASAAVSLESEDATTSALLKDQAIAQTAKAIKMSPTNTSIWRTAIRTYYDLSIIDPEFNQKTLGTFDQTIKLAPTDPKLEYNKALVLESMNRPDDEIASLQQAIRLKPNYLEAISKLADLYFTKGEFDQAKFEYQHLLQLTPGDEGVNQRLHQIATMSAKQK